MDVKIAFLYGDLEEIIYIEQPTGFEAKEGNQVCLLKRPLYGLKQSPRQWYKKFHEYMMEIGFTRCYEDTCTFVKKARDGSNEVYLLIYVDDMLVAAKDIKSIEKVKWQLGLKFDRSLKTHGNVMYVPTLHVNSSTVKNEMFIALF